MLNVKKLLTQILTTIKGDSSLQTLNTVVKYRKRGLMVYVQIYGELNLSTTWGALGTLPAGYRPANDFYFPLSTVTVNETLTGFIGTNGVIRARTAGGNRLYSVEGAITFPI